MSNGSSLDSTVPDSGPLNSISPGGISLDSITPDSSLRVSSLLARAVPDGISLRSPPDSTVPDDTLSDGASLDSSLDGGSLDCAVPDGVSLASSLDGTSLSGEDSLRSAPGTGVTSTGMGDACVQIMMEFRSSDKDAMESGSSDQKDAMEPRSSDQKDAMEPRSSDQKDAMEPLSSEPDAHDGAAKDADRDASEGCP